MILALGFFLFPVSHCAFASSMTQGEYAIKLAEKLCLGENLSADAAIAALAKLEIVPENGFKPGDPMNPVIANEILRAARKACRKGLLNSCKPCQQLSPLPGSCCDEVDALIGSLNEEMGLIPPAASTLPPPPPRDPASASS